VTTPDAVLHLSIPVSDLEAARHFYVDAFGCRVGPAEHAEVALSGKVGGKLADPSGNVIEVKCYPDAQAYRSGTRD
jgi:extradiol dioxygenase family protein